MIAARTRQLELLAAMTSQRSHHDQPPRPTQVLVGDRPQLSKRKHPQQLFVLKLLTLTAWNFNEPQTVIRLFGK